MSFVPKPLLGAALNGLKGKHPLAVVIVPAMVRAGVQVVSAAEQGAPYGSEDENALLSDYFAVPGAPAGKPYRAVWEPRLEWRNKRYPERSLQRVRKDRADAGQVFFQQPRPGPRDKHLWGLRWNCGPDLLREIQRPVRVVDLAIWYGREWDVPDLDGLVERFLAEFPLEQDSLLGTAYEQAVPPGYRVVPFQAVPVPPAEYDEAMEDAAVHAALYAAAPQTLPGAAGTASSVRELECELEPDDPMLVRVQRLLDFGYAGVIFTGPPGTGKTWHAEQIAAYLADRDPERVRPIQFHPSYQYEDFVEGYVPTSSGGGFRLEPKHLLQMCDVADRHEGKLCVIVIDELSRCDPGRVFGEALTYIEMSRRGQEFYLASGRRISIPRNLVFLATMNPLDRGVDEIDMAFERRFGKIAVEPDPVVLRGFLENNTLDPALVTGVVSFFNRLARGKNDYAKIGHAYFRTVRTDADLRLLWDAQLSFHLKKAFAMAERDLDEITRA